MTALDDRQKEQDRLARNYKLAKKRQFLELCADPLHGEWFRKFVATLNHFDINDAPRMIDYVEVQNRKWISGAAPELRAACLEAIGDRIVAIRQRAGLQPFDDPMPGEAGDVFQTCKKAMGL